MRKSYENVKEWRKNTKLRLVEAFGGKCGICEYDKSANALELHHLDPNEKEFSIQGRCIAWERIVVEMRKCVLLCANCHREVHAGDTVIPDDIKRFNEDFVNYRIGKYYDECPVCGEAKPKSQITCSKSCAIKHRAKIDWSKYDLLEMYERIGSYVGVAREIGNVSDVTIKKRIMKIKE